MRSGFVVINLLEIGWNRETRSHANAIAPIWAAAFLFFLAIGEWKTEGTISFSFTPPPISESRYLEV